MKIAWQLEILFFCQLYTWLRFHLLMETTCKILITGWQLGTEEVMALLNAGSRFHRCFVNCPAYSVVWGNDSAVDLWSCPRSLPWTGSLGSMDVIWISCEQMTWGFNATSVLLCRLCVACGRHRLTDNFARSLPLHGQIGSKEQSKLKPPEEISTISWFFITFFLFGSRSFKAGLTAPANHSISINIDFFDLVPSVLLARSFCRSDLELGSTDALLGMMRGQQQPLGMRRCLEWHSGSKKADSNL